MGVMCLGCAGTMVVLKDFRIFGIQYVLYYFIFYCLGYYINKYQLLTENRWLIAILLLVWFIMGSFWKPRELPEFIPLTGGMATMFRFVYKFSVACVAVFVMFSFAPLTMSQEGALTKLMCKLGSVSLGIYTFHLIFTYELIRFIQDYISNDVAIVLIGFVILSITSYCVMNFIGRWKWSARILLGKF